MYIILDAPGVGKNTIFCPASKCPLAFTLYKLGKNLRFGMREYGL